MHASNALTQAQAVEQFLPTILNSPLARKTVTVQAFEVKVPMHVVTVLANGQFEGAPVANPGDFVIVNPGGEMYPNEPDYFNAKYDHVNGNIYQAKGRAFAYEYVGEPFSLVTSWDVFHPVESGDYLVCPEGKSEVYRIARQEFDDTYTFDGVE